MRRHAVAGFDADVDDEELGGIVGVGDLERRWVVGIDQPERDDVGDAALGIITSQHYSAAHDSPENKAFVAAFKKANNGMRPNLMAMQAYDEIGRAHV